MRFNEYLNEAGFRGRGKFKGKRINLKRIPSKKIKMIRKKFRKPRKVRKPRFALDKKFFGKLKKNATKVFQSIFKKMRLQESESDKARALANYLEIDIEDIDYTGYEYETPEGDYMVLTDQEADDAVKEYIEDSIWAFNKDFLMAHIDIDELIKYWGFDTDYYDEDEDEYIEIGDSDEVFYLNTGMTLEEWIDEKQRQAEGGNDDLYSAILDIDHFVEDAIISDGRGHFLNRYDGEEHEAGKYFVYQTN